MDTLQSDPIECIVDNFLLLQSFADCLDDC